MGPRLGLAKEESLTSASIVHKKSLHERKGTYPPIIIIGMHRSGTSLLSRMLEDLGLFLGKIKDENHEAVFFQAINDWLLRQAGGAWDNPTPIQYLLDNPEMSERTSDYIRHYLLTSPRAASYVGWLNYLRHRCLVPLTRPWGWKDPRNTFTLPIWLSIFPRAKIIHLHRSGMDVALSLRRRGRQEFRLQQSYRSVPFLHWIRPKRGGFVHSLRCDQLVSKSWCASPSGVCLLQQSFAICPSIRPRSTELRNISMPACYRELLSSRVMKSLCTPPSYRQESGK